MNSADIAPDFVVRVVMAAETEAAAVIQAALQGLPLKFFTAGEPWAAFALVQEHRPRLVLLDCAMADNVEDQLLQRILDLDPGLDVMLLGADGSTDAAVEAIRRGAAS